MHNQKLNIFIHQKKKRNLPVLNVETLHLNQKSQWLEPSSWLSLEKRRAGDPICQQQEEAGFCKCSQEPVHSMTRNKDRASMKG